MIRDERLYIAAPVCFYPRGQAIWHARRDEAEFYGFGVTCPDREKREMPKEPAALSKAIFDNCARMMADSTICIADLENFRGFMPDGGTVYEIGMAYGRGLPIYGHTRDKRGMGVKYMGGVYETRRVLTKDGAVLPNKEFAFDTCLTAACKIVEGSFSDCLRTVMEDLEQQSKQKAVRGFGETQAQPCETIKRGERPIVYVSDFYRYDADAPKRYAAMRRVLDEAGFDAIFPTDPAPGVPQRDFSADPMAALYNRFDHYQQHVRNCDIILANLNDYLGYEPASDTGFECGMAFELGKKLFGFMEDAGPVKDRIAHVEENGRVCDANGYTIENLGAAQNLMFGGSFNILGGGFEAAVKQMARALNG